MNGMDELLRDVLVAHGWTVPESTPDYRVRHFDLVAENDSAIVFAATSSSDDLTADSRRLGASIALFMQDVPGDKTWEGYLLLFVPLLSADHQEEITSVQRDLTFCRRVVIDTSTLVASPDPKRTLESRLSFLFPLSVADTTGAPDSEVILRNRLLDHGHPEPVTDALLRGMDDNQFDPIAFLTAAQRAAR
jgi:hypothetical protein